MVAFLFGLAKALKTRIMQLRMLIKGTLSTQVDNQGRVCCCKHINIGIE
jgi:hypothetical protein